MRLISVCLISRGVNHSLKNLLGALPQQRQLSKPSFFGTLPHVAQLYYLRANTLVCLPQESSPTFPKEAPWYVTSRTPTFPKEFRWYVTP